MNRLDDIERIDIQLILQEQRSWAILGNLFTYLFSGNYKRRKASVLAFIFNFLFSRSTISIGLIGLAGLYFNWKSNALTEKQNLLIKQQYELAVATKNSSVLGMITSISESIQYELTKPKNTNKELSELLIARIIALSNTFEPYDINGRLLSPERGHLLTILSYSKMSSKSLAKIYSQCNFKYSDLSYKTLKNANFKGADLSGSRLYNSDFEGSNLDGLILASGTLEKCNFNDVSCVNCSFSCKIDSCLFFEANLTGTVFSKCEILNSNFSWADFKGAQLVDDTYINNSHFHYSNISEIYTHDKKGDQSTKLPYDRVNTDIKNVWKLSDTCCEPSKNNGVKIDTIFTDAGSELKTINYFKSFETTYLHEGKIIRLANKGI